MSESETGSSKLSRPGSHLTIYILVAITLAIALALVAPHAATQFEVGGEIFLRLLMMMVVPLVMASVMSGIIGLGDVRKLGRPGLAAVTYYATTTMFAVLVGIVAVNLIEPGVGIVNPEQIETLSGEEVQQLEEAGTRLDRRNLRESRSDALHPEPHPVRGRDKPVTAHLFFPSSSPAC